MTFNVVEFTKMMNIVENYFILSKYFNNRIKNYGRIMYKDGRLYFSMNNHDVKLICSMRSEFEGEFNKVFIIPEIFYFTKSLVNYETFKIDGAVAEYDNGEYIFSDIEDTKEFQDNLSIDEISDASKLEYKNSFQINSNFISSFDNIFKFLQMKSNEYNFYFFDETDDGNYAYFDFAGVFVKARIDDIFVPTDLYSIRILRHLLDVYLGDFMNINNDDDVHIFETFGFSEGMGEKVPNFYMLGKTLDLSSKFDECEFTKSVFDKHEDIEEITVGLGFNNYINMVLSIDEESQVSFLDKRIVSSSKVIQGSNFKYADDKVSLNNSFMVKASTMARVLKFLLKDNKSINDFRVFVVNTDHGLYVKFIMDSYEVMVTAFAM